MKKITTVMIAMLLLTLSVLAAHADQEGNARWCNIDNDGCYLNEEGGVKSYMYFWTVESCKFFMGNDDPCKNVVPRYYSADGRHPLDPAPEPIVYKPLPKKLVVPVEEILELLEEVLDENLPEDLTTEELQELIKEVVQKEELPEDFVEFIEEVKRPDETLVEFFEEVVRGRVRMVKGMVMITDGTTVPGGSNFIPAAEAGILPHAEGDTLLIPVVRYKTKDGVMLDVNLSNTDIMEITGGSMALLDLGDGEAFNSVLAPGLDPKFDDILEYEVIGYTIPESVAIDPEHMNFDGKDNVEEISGGEPEYERDDEGNVVGVSQSFKVDLTAVKALYKGIDLSGGNKNTEDISNNENDDNNNINENTDNNNGSGPDKNQGDSESGTSQLSVRRAKTAELDPDSENQRWADAKNSANSFKRLEAVRLKQPNNPMDAITEGISYETHAENGGWHPAAENGALAGANGQSKRLEAVKFSLSGDKSGSDNQFSAWYRIHSQTYGWLGWANEGSNAGTTGLGNRAEVVDMQVLPDGRIPRE